MTLEQDLLNRSENKCELCGDTTELALYTVSGASNLMAEDESAILCNICIEQIENVTQLNEQHWRCLNDSMWSSVPAVQVLAYRQLHALNITWANDLLDILYLEAETLAWAKQDITTPDDASPCKDSNGITLNPGDTVTLIKDLVVKGANFTAKRGTSVKHISLSDNPGQIEGKINGTRIVLLSKFLKKA